MRSNPVVRRIICLPTDPTIYLMRLPEKRPRRGAVWTTYRDEAIALLHHDACHAITALGLVLDRDVYLDDVARRKRA